MKKLLWLCLRHVRVGMYDQTGKASGQNHACCICRRPAATRVPGWQVLGWLLMALSLGAQDLSTFKRQEFQAYVFPPCEPKHKVACTHDADTPTVQIYTRLVGGSYKIRLRGVDAPELEQPRGREAMAALFRLLGAPLTSGTRAARVYVEGRDKYGRTLGVLYTTDGADVNLLLVANGYAWVDDGRMPKARRRQLEAAQATARERKLGLWADPKPIKPSAWRKGER